jgi:ABC-type dipeptide/oligopeptide/nickel transport system ATPase component
MTVAINIRGTSGAGKSHLVRSIMALYDTAEPTYTEGRKKPYYTHLSHRDMAVPQLCVPGHYETPCGGCDTIKTGQEVWAIVLRSIEAGHNCLFEGIMPQDWKIERVEQLAGLTELHIIQLNTPIELCLEAVRGRRAARGNEKPLSPKNTVSRARNVEARIRELRRRGIACHTVDRDGAFALCRTLLGV